MGRGFLIWLLGLTVLSSSFACGGSEATNEQASEETTSEETTSEEAVGAGGRVTGWDYNVCALGTAYYEGKREEIDKFLEDWSNRTGETIAQNMQKDIAQPGPNKAAESEKADVETLEEALKAEGYECDLEKYNAYAKEEAEKAKESVRQEFAEQQAETGVNEAGQDISNIPKTKPDPERAKCLSDYLRSQGNNAGAEQQRVTREANDRGVMPYEVVGC